MPVRAGEGPLALAAADHERLERHAEAAVRRARRRGEALVAVTIAAEGIDPTAATAAARRPAEPWFCFEQPQRGDAALAGLGCAAVLDDAGPGRFKRVAARWRELAAGAVCDPADGPRGTGPVAVGGFAFAPGGAAAPHWAGFAPASLHVPEIAVARRDGAVSITLAALARPDDTPAEIVRHLAQRLAQLDPTARLPLLDPDPVGEYRVASSMPPEHYEGAVARAVEHIRAGTLEKIVLTREVQVHAPVAHDAAAVVGVLREAFRNCHVFCVARGDAAFLAASPELLIRREGRRAGTLALAGSTRRSADPAVDAHLGEQLLGSGKDRAEHDIVVRRIAAVLRQHALWVTHPDEPEVARIANVQHLATPIRAQLREPLGAVELAGMLHPTPAVGGEPADAALPLIPALEGLDRGWYAGPVGWVDRDGDGEFCVALRCALLRGGVARCYAGGGIVGDSDPADELAETEVKLQALLPVLAG